MLQNSNIDRNRIVVMKYFAKHAGDHNKILIDSVLYNQ